MADKIVLSSWPSCVHAIDWSPDGVIALACVDQVHLLFPSTKPYDSDEDNSQWRHFSLQVPWFTREELPLKDNAPSQTFSIGEEISASTPVCLSWSPSGLTRHRRCALAALTTNLILSIWSSEGDPQDEKTWDRRLMINDTLENYFFNTVRDDTSRLVSGFEESVRLRRRVRTYAWAPSMYDGQVAGSIGTQISWGKFLIAISNDDNQVVIVAVNSPTSTLGVSETWSAEVLAYFAVTPDPESGISDPCLIDELLQRQQHVSHITWSPWIEIGGSFHSVIAYATNQDVRARVVMYSTTAVKFGPEVVYPNTDIQFTGPIKWSPRVQGDTLTLALFTNAKVICLTISIFDASILQQATHHFDGRWDSISGVSFDVRFLDFIELHFSSLMSPGRYSTAVLKHTATELSAIDSRIHAHWWADINGLELLFDAQYDLGGNAKLKMWGLSTSPLGDFVASCHTMHPADMIEYGPSADRKSTITIRHMSGSGELSFRSGNISSEGVIFTGKKWIANRIEDEEKLPEEQKRIQEKLLQVYDPKGNDPDSSIAASAPYTSTDLSDLLTAFKQNTLLDRNTLSDRYNILTSLICTPSAPTDLAKTMIAFRLATALQTLPRHYSRVSLFSETIFAQSLQVIRFVHKLTSDTPNTSASTETEYVEACGFCNAPIPLDSIATATCKNGHQYTRCGLSFLAIQYPGITKNCGVCSTPYLSEEFVLEQEEDERTESQTPEDEVVDMEHARGEKRSEARDAPAETTMTTGPQLAGNREPGLPASQSSALEGHGTEETHEQLADPKTGTSTDQRTIVEGTRTELVVQGPEIAVNEAQGEKSGDAALETNHKEVDRGLPISLARVLFLGCDVCIYCGGKFVG